MDLFIILYFVFFINSSFANTSDDETIDRLAFQTDISSLDPQGRISWTGNSKRNGCGGTITKLSNNQATLLKSHRQYGIEPYPENYQCRWLFIPDQCNLGFQCSLGTNHNRRRGRTTQKCLDGDYLRILGNKGLEDRFYCGQKNLNITFNSNDSVALVFRSLNRSESISKITFDHSSRQAGILSSILKGFDCKITCKNDDNNANIDRKDDIDTTTLSSVPTTSSESLRPLKNPFHNNKPQTINCRCGKTRQARIVCPPESNCTASLGSIPWQASIVHKHRHQPWCGGTLINDRYILTAAHCLKNKIASKIQVVLGDFDWTSKSDTNEIRLDVDNIINHPRFGKLAQFDYDFSLVKLSQPVSFIGSGYVLPACLPKQPLLEEDDLLDKIAQISGWGVLNPKEPKIQARKLKKTLVKIMSNNECLAKYRENLLTDNMMCAAYPNTDACFGDSGGPMTIQENNSEVLEGVISWGKDCAKSRWPGVYARVRKVLDWIYFHTQDAKYCAAQNEQSNRRNLQFTNEKIVFA